MRWRSINPLRFISRPLLTFTQPFAHLGLFHCCLRARPNRYATQATSPKLMTEKAWKKGKPASQLSGALGWPTERLRELKRLQKFYTDDVHQSPPSDWLRKQTTSQKHYLDLGNGGVAKYFPGYGVTNCTSTTSPNEKSTTLSNLPPEGEIPGRDPSNSRVY